MRSQPTARILVVEDDSSISLGLRMNLEGAGYEVGIAEDGETGLRRAKEESWDLVILDVMLPRLNGFELLCALRSDQRETPVLMLSAKTTDVDKIMGLDLGADDYVTKPFSVFRTGSRECAPSCDVDHKPLVAAEEAWSFGDVSVDPQTRLVLRHGKPVDLTATEFDVLAVLYRARGRILSRRQVMDSVWGTEHHGTERTVDNFVAQLRAKLEIDPAAPKHILTVRGVGYRLAM